MEETGFKTTLRYVGALRYRAEVDGLIEHEFDHVFIGQYDGPVRSNPLEVAAWQWVTTERLKAAVARNPDRYTPWFRLLLDYVLDRRAGENDHLVSSIADISQGVYGGISEAVIVPAQ